MEKHHNDDGVQHIPLRSPFNDDDEIIIRLDECEHLMADCPNKNCPCRKKLLKRQRELKRSLVDHWLF